MNNSHLIHCLNFISLDHDPAISSLIRAILAFPSFLLRSWSPWPFWLPFSNPPHPSSDADTRTTHTTPDVGALSWSSKTMPSVVFWVACLRTVTIFLAFWLPRHTEPRFAGNWQWWLSWAFPWVVAASFSSAPCKYGLDYSTQDIILSLWTLKLMCHLSAPLPFFWQFISALFLISQLFLHVRNFFYAISIQSAQKPLVGYFGFSASWKSK